jgi:hypothetical protein
MEPGSAVGKPADEEEQLLQMSNERFTVPELLFNPSSLGAFVHKSLLNNQSYVSCSLLTVFRLKSSWDPRSYRSVYFIPPGRSSRYVLE